LNHFAGHDSTAERAGQTDHALTADGGHLDGVPVRVGRDEGDDAVRWEIGEIDGRAGRIEDVVMTTVERNEVGFEPPIVVKRQQ
jgi:hypothetical protein